ncbi:MAG: site-specific integrase, partial [Candidatus Dadabacteria bacterium]|nr:site-specific integrase [Candidatus Dadabacteria bacterium]
MDVLLDSFLSYLAVEKGLSENTLESYGRDLRKFIRFMEETGAGAAGEIKYSHILDYLSHFKE